MQHADRRVPAVGELRRAGAQESDPAVRQPAAVVVVPLTLGQLSQLAAIHIDGPQMIPLAAAATPTEQHLASVVGQIAVQNLAVMRIHQLDILRFGLVRRDHVQPAAVALAFVMIRVDVRRGDFVPFDDQQPVDVEQQHGPL